jgi:hypothetical protein
MVSNSPTYSYVLHDALRSRNKHINESDHLRLIPVLIWYLGKMHGVNNQHKYWYHRTIFRCHICNSSQIFIFGGFVQVRESLYTQLVFIWVNFIPNHIDTRVILPRYEGLPWYGDLNGEQKCHPTLTLLVYIDEIRPGIRGTQVKSSVWMKKRRNHLNDYFWAI